MSYCEGDTLQASLERRIKAEEDAKRPRYKPVTVNLTFPEYDRLKDLLQTMRDKKLLGSDSGARGLVLKRALQVYEQRVSLLPDTGLENQHEQGALVALKRRKSSSPAQRVGTIRRDIAALR